MASGITKSVTVALDAMGGDKAPDIVIRGASIACERFPSVHFLLFGPEGILAQELNRFPNLAKRATVVDCPDVISNHDVVSKAIRQGRASSMWKAIEAVRDGRAHCVVSAGNTGVLMAMSKLLLRPVAGVSRPAICTFFPTKRGQSVMLDLGANVECDAENLVQFAVMGQVYAKTVLGFLEPTVGILNVGSEEHKGLEYLKEAADILRRVPALKFHGFIEGNDIAEGTVDVVVTDGFTGNVALKTAEGVGALYGQFLKDTIRHSIFAKIGYFFSRRAFHKIRYRLDPRRYNGAVFLGLNGISIKSHGGTDALGFATAIGVAVNLTEHHFLDDLKQALAQVPAARGVTAIATGTDSRTDNSAEKVAHQV